MFIKRFAHYSFRITLFVAFFILFLPSVVRSDLSTELITTIPQNRIDIPSVIFIQTSTNTYVILATTTDQKCQLMNVTINGSILWQQKYSGAKNERAANVVQTKDDGYLLAGSTAKNDVHYHCLIIKSNETGVEQWRKIYPSPGEEKATAMIATTDNRYAIVGYTRSNGSINYDVLLIIVDHKGNELIRKTYGTGHLLEKALSIIQTADGGFALVGYTESEEYRGYDFG